jgi:glucokinase
LQECLVSYIDIVTTEDSVLGNSTGHVLVFDVGGSHIAASVSASNGLLVETPQSVAVSKSASLLEFLETFASLSKRTLPGAAVPLGVSIAMPNPFDYVRGISYMRHKYEYLYGIELRSKLSHALGCAPEKIQFLNDAAAFLIGEIHQGAARGLNRAVGITLGTGVGSAFASGGEIVTEGRGVPAGGEIWNLSYKDGIVEKFVSTSAIQENYKLRTGIREEVQVIANQSETNQEARKTFEQFGKELGEVFRATCVGFRPERIILGGGISRSSALFLPSAEMELVGLGIELRVSQLGERAALTGAAVDWMKKHNHISQLTDSTRTTEEA